MNGKHALTVYYRSNMMSEGSEMKDVDDECRRKFEKEEDDVVVAKYPKFLEVIIEHDEKKKDDEVVKEDDEKKKKEDVVDADGEKPLKNSKE